MKNIIESVLGFLDKNALRFLYFLLAVFCLANWPKENYSTLAYDGLHSEFSAFLAIKRSLFAVWQQYQSFGLLAGMAHGADLPRSIFAILPNAFLPFFARRAVSHILLYAAGGLSSFYFFKRFISMSKHVNLLALIGSLLYLGNYQVIQIFALPMEPFSIFFAFLPLALLTFDLFTTSLSKISSLTLIVVNLILMSAFVSQQNFIIYIFVIIFLSIQKIMINRVDSYKRIFFAILLIFLVNLQWIAPQAYFLYKNSSLIFQNKQNSLATLSVQTANAQHANLSSFFSGQGLYHDLVGQNQTPILANWHHFTNSDGYQFSIYFIGILFVFGLFNFRQKYYPFFLMVLCLVYFFEFSTLWQIIRTNISYLLFVKFAAQIFRSPFTKFFAVYALTISYFFIIGIIQISLIVQKVKTKYMPQLFFAILVIITIFTSLFRLKIIFSGHIYARESQVILPPSYEKTFSYFRNLSSQNRIALLPELSFWGWYQSKFGYNGSGFWWYGLPQSTISRTFDVWSSTSQSYYFELQSAIQSGEIQKFEYVLRKYRVDYLIFDQNQLAIVGSSKANNLNNTQDLLIHCRICTLERNFDDIQIYKVHHSHEKNTNVMAFYDQLPKVFQPGPLEIDFAFQKYLDYLQVDKNETTEVFPFANLVSFTPTPDSNFILTEYPTTISLELANINSELKNFASSRKVQYSLFQNNGEVFYDFNIDQKFAKGSFVTSIPKVTLYTLSNIQILQSKCIASNTASISLPSNTAPIKLAPNTSACLNLQLPLRQKYAYLIKLKQKNDLSRPPHLAFISKETDVPYIEESLIASTRYYFIPAKNIGHQGYQLDIELKNENKEASFQFEELAVYLFPWEEIASTSLTSDSNKVHHTTIASLNAANNLPFLYVFPSPKTKANGIALKESFDEGWQLWHKASKFNILFFPFLEGTKVEHKFALNSTFTYFELDQNQTFSPEGEFVAIYWPQYLQFFPQVLLLLLIVFLVQYRIYQFWTSNNQRK